MSARRILFITHCEQGQSNIHLATAFEIHERAIPGLEVHLASFALLRKRFEGMRTEGAVRGASERRLPRFHTINGLPHVAGVRRAGTMRHRPGFEMWPKVAHMMVPYTPEEFMNIVDSIISIVEAVDPHLIIIDALFGQAGDACDLLGRPYNVLSPLLASLICMQDQSFFPLRYPLPGTGYAYPLTPRTILLNLCHCAAMVYYGLETTALRAVNAARAARGLSGEYQDSGCLRVTPGRAYICPSICEVDLPFKQPDNLHLCGPISNDFGCLRESDPELVAWLDRAPTVLMIMGTHFGYDAPLARRVLDGLLSGVGPDMQILWKVPSRGVLDSVFDAVLVSARERERVRAVTWFDAEPAAILEHENIVAYVHHGGANSYFECAKAGKPQVVLAQWADTYYNAATVEWAGLGVYGNKTCAPDIDDEELSVALRRITAGAEGKRFMESARRVGVKCREAGGRKTAADVVLSLLNS